MINEFRTFQYCVLFAKELFRAGLISRDEFAARLYRLGYLPAEVQSEVRDIMTKEAHEISKNLYL